MIVETDAVVLQSRKFGDTSKIVTVYTHEYGKLNIMAKGCRSPKSKFSAMLEPMSCLQITFYKKTSSDLHLLSKSEIKIPFRKIFDSYDHIMSGMLIMETMIQSQHESEKNEELFELLVKSIEILNKVEDNPFSVFVVFQLELAKIMGFDVMIDDEMLNIGSDYFFSYESGTIFADRIPHNKNTFRFSGNLLKKLAKLVMAGFEGCSENQFNDREKSLLAAFFSGYFSFHLDRKFSFRTMNIMN